MGVKGLMTYMLNDGTSLKSYKLHKSKVIIDGNNLLHSIHHAHNLVWQFGGEYESFDKALVKFFHRLEECELEPFVVFDGCYDAEGSKIRTTISRFKDRLYTCAQLNKQYPSNGYLLPMLALSTMISVLNRLNINFVTCHEEADKEAAALANYFNCPIISNDSDFFIFPLSCGFIPVGSLNFIPVKELCQCCPNLSHFYISCAIFHQSNFHLKSSNDLRVNEKFLPLFSTLMGNDYFLSVDLFEKIFLQNSNGRKSKKIGKSTSKISILLKWLMEFDNIDCAIERVVQSVKDCDRMAMKNVIKSSIEQYNISQSNLVDSFQSDSQVKIDNGNQSLFASVPDFIITRLNRSILSPILINSLISGKVFLSAYVESISNNSIHSISSEIRNRFYRILMKLSNKSSGSIVEYTRKEKSMFKIQISIDEINNNIENGSINKNLLDSVIIDNSFGFIDAMICYWIADSVTANKTEDNWKFQSILAGIVAVYIQLAWKSELAAINRTGNGLDFAKEQYNSPIYKFFKDPIVTNVNKFQIRLVHGFNELQSIYFSLSQLLGLDPAFDPDLVPSPQSLFCGKLNYNLCADLRKRKNCWNFVCQLFDTFPCCNVNDQFLATVDKCCKISGGFDSFLGINK